MCLSYLLDADLLGNRKKLTSEVSVSDLEYADDMALISDSYESLSSLLKSLDSSCHHMGLTINYKKTKLLAVLPGADTHPPSPISLHPDCDPIEVVPSFQYLGSYFLTIAPWTLRYQHGSPKHLSHMGHLTASFGTRRRSSLQPS